MIHTIVQTAAAMHPSLRFLLKQHRFIIGILLLCGVDVVTKTLQRKSQIVHN